MRAIFLVTLLGGLLLGVRAMLVGIARSRAQIRRAPILNLPTIGALLAAFGATGYLLDRYSQLGSAAVLIIAAVVGGAAAAGIFTMIAGWAVPSAVRDPEDPRFALQGHPGHVVRELPAGSEGTIEYAHDGLTHQLPARSLSGAAVAVGTEIVIERVEDGIAHVELWSVIEQEIGSH
jgi:hypothetical protein